LGWFDIWETIRSAVTIESAECVARFGFGFVVGQSDEDDRSIGPAPNDVIHVALLSKNWWLLRIATKVSFAAVSLSRVTGYPRHLIFTA
jgi:hypothetical protein